MPTTTVENYLKQVYQLQQRRPARDDLVAMGKLADRMSVAAGTATAMVKTLAEAGLVDYEPRGGVRLTAAGEKIALQVLRRHRLIELFLVDILKLDWSEVHEEAEELEHAVSEKVLEKIDALLGHPRTDPHGDPIPPPPHLTHVNPPPAADSDPHTTDLRTCPTRSPLRIQRVLDQDPHFLRFLDEHGLMPGTRITVQARHPAADAVTVHPDDHPPVALGHAAAAKILVALAPNS